MYNAGPLRSFYVSENTETMMTAAFNALVTVTDSMSVCHVLQFTSSVDFEVCLTASESRQLATEQCRQHATVNAKHCVQSQQQVGIAQSL